MDINLETVNKHSIQAYSDTEVKINGVLYTDSLIVSEKELVTNWSINKISDLNHDSLSPLLNLHPEIIILGSHQKNQRPIALLQLELKQKIGIECMSIGAACRTFNVLLSEHRNVVLGVIF